MKKLIIATFATALVFGANFAFADAASTNGQGDGKGHSVADAVSKGGAADKGDASVASTATGGWGQAGGVAQGGSFESK
jgi:hypothetical protein